MDLARKREYDQTTVVESLEIYRFREPAERLVELLF